MFEDVVDAIDSPAYGPMAFGGRDRPQQLHGLTEEFEEAEELLDAEFEEAEELLDAEFEDVIGEDVECGFY